MNSIQTCLGAAKAFIFDFYGTLVEVDREPPQMWETLNELGYDSHPQLQAMWESDAFNGCITPSFHSDPNYDEWRRANLRQFVNLSGVPDPLVESILSMLLDIDRQATKKAVPQANSVLRLLRQHHKKIGLCSNWDYAIQPYLDQAGLPEFDGITISAEIGARKPNAVLFFDICSKLGVNPNDAIFIGDNWSTDIVGAIRSGLLPVWIRNENEPGSLLHHVIEFETLADFETQLKKTL